MSAPLANGQPPKPQATPGVPIAAPARIVAVQFREACWHSAVAGVLARDRATITREAGGVTIVGMTGKREPIFVPWSNIKWVELAGDDVPDTGRAP